MQDDMGPELFARDGRLTDLALELYELGELDAAAVAAVEAHLAADPAEAERLDTLRDEGADFAALPVPDFAKLAAAAAPPAPELPSALAPSGASEVPAPANAGWSWGVIVMAALALLVVGLSLRSGERGVTGAAIGVGADWEVEARGPVDGRLELSVASRSSGHWMLVRVPTAGPAVPVHPVAAIGRSARVSASNGPMQLELAGVALAEGERLVAVRCAGPFGVGDVSLALLDAREHPVEDGGCVAQAVRP